ncbi:MAG TPA: serine/threonine-protein kinase [Polyangiaceae bacterium]
MSYASGDVVAGKYALEELLGQGGMGAVFRARNTAIDMPVAIKLLRADLDRQLLSGRLLQEARAAAQLSHPAIVRVFDVGKTGLGDPFIVMELLIGETLASLIEREGRLTATRAVQLLLPIADGLSAAHAKGFVHRDVKPDNVFIVDDDGQLQPKLVDFGIVKLEAKSGESQLTQVGVVLGSPEYMSPEQARGVDNIDLRSDVWSFSIVLYEALSGATPFESKNYNALLRKIVEEEAPTLQELLVADPALSAIVARGMSKDPAQRWPSLGQMGKALAGWLSEAGLSEDACGSSLAKWLSRTATDPPGARASRASIPDSWPDPTSGLRAVQLNLANAPTQHASRPAATPLSVTPSTAASAPAPPSKRAYKVGLAAATLVALVIGLLLLFSRRAPEAAPPPTAAPLVTPLPAPTLAVISASPPAPVAAAAEPEQAEPARTPSRQPPTRAGVAPRPKGAAVGASPAPASSAAAPRQTPASDLLQPY